MNIALDVDGVLLNLNKAFRMWVEHQFGILIGDSAITHWDYEYTFGIPKTLTQGMWEFMWSTPLQPFPGALKFIKDLQAAGHQVHLISNRPKGFYGAREAAERDFPRLGADLVHILDNTPKSEVLNSVGARLFVDDNPENCVEAAENWAGKVLLMVRPYNETCTTLLGSWTPVRTYDDIWWEVNQL